MQNLRQYAVDCLVPLLLSRSILMAVGWASQVIPLDPNRPPYALKGWWTTPHSLIDFWVRWDSGWYMAILKHDYFVRGDWTVQSNIAFFPLYPYVARWLSNLLPIQLRQSDAALFAVGLLVSNAALLGALIAVHAITERHFDLSAARRAVWLILLFPTSFFLSSFYPEAIFLFLSLGAFWACVKRSWGVACLLAALLVVTKAQGVFIAIPLVWFYLASLNWRMKSMRAEAVWFLAIPATLGAFFLRVFELTGDPLAPLAAQQAWGRTLASPWQTFTALTWHNPYYAQLERVLALALIPLCLLALRKLPAQYAVYAFAVSVPALFSGSISDIGRHFLLAFPLFIASAAALESPRLRWAVYSVSVVLQALCMAGWVRFYAIV